MDINEMEKFMNYAKVSNTTYNPSEYFLCLIERLNWLERRVMELHGELDYLRDDDENIPH